MKRIALVATLVLLICGLATPAGAITQSQLRSKALAISDMPSGWSVDNSTSGGISNAGGCFKTLQSLKHPTKGITRVEVAYTQRQVPALQETLIAGKGASSRYNKYVSVLNSCKSVSLTESNGTTITGSVGAMSFPTVGNASAAFAVNLTSQGINIGVDIVLFRVDKVLGDIVYEDIGSPDTSTLEGFVTKAVNKIAGNAKNSSGTAPSSSKSNSSGTGGTPKLPQTFAGNAVPALHSEPSGQLSVAFVGTPYSLGSGDGTMVPVEVFNGTDQSVAQVDVSGAASSGSAVVGSGDSQDVEPAVLAPGEVAFGMVFYTQDLPAGVTFTLTATGSNETSNVVNIKVVQANYSGTGGIAGSGVVGSVMNPSSTNVNAPVQTDLYCFSPTGTLQSVNGGFMAGNGGLPPGASGSYSIDIEGPAPCTSDFLVGSSGYTF